MNCRGSRSCPTVAHLKIRVRYVYSLNPHIPTKSESRIFQHHSEHFAAESIRWEIECTHKAREGEWGLCILRSSCGPTSNRSRLQ